MPRRQKTRTCPARARLATQQQRQWLPYSRDL